MSDININGIPNMGFQGAGGGYFAQPGAGLANAYASQAQALNFNASLARMRAMSQAALNPQTLYGAQGFGGRVGQYAPVGGGGNRNTASRTSIAMELMRNRRNQPAIDAVQRMSLGGRYNPAAPRQSSSPFDSTPSERMNDAPAYDPDSFGNRFGAGGYYNPGQPSQYSTNPYTNTQGNTFHPGPLPPGFSPPYSVDNPGGALPLNSPFGMNPNPGS